MREAWVTAALLLAAGCVDPVCREDADCADGLGCVEGACVEASAQEACGDGVVEAGEDCDEGAANGAPESACGPGCLQARCGDGVVQPSLGESCDEGEDANSAGGGCGPRCVPVACGDGVAEAAEACDEGPEANLRGRHCRADCTAPSCGDGVVDAPYEDCDDAAASTDFSETCTGACRVPSCGDGVITRATEACDGGPGCTAACAFEGCGAVELVAGAGFTLVRRADGVLRAAGSDAQGELGRVDRGADVLSPEDLDGAGLVQLAAGEAFVIARTAAGTVVTWGSNVAGQRGLSVLEERPGRSEVPGLPPIVDVAAGAVSAFALDEDGAIWSWGGAYYRELGGDDGVVEACPIGHRCRPEPRRLEVAGVRFVDVAAGPYTALAIDERGELWGFGQAAFGQLGHAVAEACPDGVNVCVRAPDRVGVGGVVRAAAGQEFTLFLDRRGALRGLGRIAYAGAPADAPELVVSTPTPIPLASGARIHDVAAGPYHALVLDEAGVVHAGGGDDDGRLGRGPFVGVTPLAEVPGLGRATQVAAALAHSGVLLDDGSVVAFGTGANGQLGQGDGAPSGTPVAFPVCP